MSDDSPGRHLRVVRSEFARQAEAFAASATLRAPDITDRIAEALGDAPRERILDLACGPGVLAPVLAARAGRIVGVDFTSETLRVARSRSAEAGVTNAAWLRGVAERTPLAPRSFDAVVLRLALHHFERPAAVLAEVARVLRPGGRLVVLDILSVDDPETAALHNAIERLRDPSHTAFVSLERLEGSIADAGFETVTQATWQTPRTFADWAAIIADERRMASLERVLRELARAGVSAGIALREQDGELWFTYEWAMVVADLPVADGR